MNKVMILSAVAAVLTMSVCADFEADAKKALRETAALAEAKLKTADALGQKAITLLPVKGDDAGYFENLLVGAFVNAGRTLVVSNDEKKDERFKRILGEIKWDEKQTTLKSVDPTTIDALGKLKSTQVFVEAHLEVTKRKNGKVAAELNLLAYEIETKKFVWSVNLAPEGGVSSTKPKICAKVETVYNGKASGEAAELLNTAVKQQMVDLGYVVDGAEGPDVIVKLFVQRTTFDTTGSYLVFDGTVHVTATAQGSEKRLLGKETLSARGARGLGEEAADKNLVVKLAEKTGTWFKDTLSLTALRVKHPEFIETIVE